jgi:D-alanine-D-alanine ligase
MNRRVVVLGNNEAGAPIVAALSSLGYEAATLAPAGDLTDRLKALAPDIVFFGHDDRSGRVQGLLELLGIPYTHSGILATALAANRHQAKVMLRAVGLPVTDHLLVDRAAAAQQHQVAPPYVVKPAVAGAIGGRAKPAPLAVLSVRDDPPAALLGPDWREVEAVMVERYMPGRSVCVAVMGGVALGVSEWREEDGEAPDGAQKIQLVTPARISPNIYEKLQKMSLKAHEVLDCRGVTEIGFRLDDRASGESGLVCLGVNTQPGLGAGAPVPEQARHAGHSFADLVAWMVEDGSCNR